MTEHLLLPGVDAVEKITLQIHQDVVTYIVTEAQHVKCTAHICENILMSAL